MKHPKVLTRTAAWIAAPALLFAAALAQADVATTPAAANDDVLAVAGSDGRFDTFTRLVEASGLAGALSGDGPVTIFAPTDEAFAKLPAADLEALLQPANRDKLAGILTYHVVPGKALARDDLKKLRKAETVAGETVKLALVNGRVRVNDARVAGEIEASNGTILPIDRILLPQ